MQKLLLFIFLLPKAPFLSFLADSPSGTFEGIPKKFLPDRTPAFREVQRQFASPSEKTPDPEKKKAAFEKLISKIDEKLDKAA